MKKEKVVKQLPTFSHTIDSWRIFRILSEFVEGFEKMTAIGPSVVFFGSSTTKPNDPSYKQAVKLAGKIAKKGFAVVTGGGPGLMEAANKGAQHHGISCGLCIDLPSEEEPNPYIDKKFLLRFRYFFVRKVMFVRYAKAFVALPGGYGTLNELFECLTLIATKKAKQFPIYLVGKAYWKGLIDWMKNTLVARGSITEKEFKLLILTDDLDAIVNGIERHYKKEKTIENF